MARTLHVAPNRRGAYPTIRDALDAVTGETVISVGPGEYFESLDLTGMQVTIVAAEGSGTVTVDARSADGPAIQTGGGGAVGLHHLTLRAGDTAAVHARGRGTKLRMEESWK